MEIESIILDDGREYFIVDNVTIDNVTYVLFLDTENDKEIRIRKLVMMNNEEFYVGINDDDEIKKVIIAFDKKMNS